MATQDEKIKWVEGSPFMVDGFRFASARCKHYLLTHFHSDHTTGLYSSFSAGTIYTSQGTAKLIIELIGVNAERVVALPMNVPTFVAGFELTLLDANHCPAAVMFVIRDPRPGGRTSLHTGDFRADQSVCTNPLVASLKGRLDSLYLDTTYCGPRHTFPDQREVLEQAARMVRLELQRDPNTLFVVGTYSIGKEKVLEAVAKAAGSRCLVNARKARIMRLSGAWKESTYTTHDASTGGGVSESAHARVRAAPLRHTNSPSALLSVLAAARAAGAPFTSIVGVRPTGWAFTNGAKTPSSGGKTLGGALFTRGGSHGDGSAAADRASTASASAANAAAAASSPGPAGDVSNETGDGAEAFRDSFMDDAEDADDALEGDEQDDEAAAWGAGAGSEENAAEDVEGPSFDPAEGGVGASWAGKKPWVQGNARVYSLPYSEHSSFPQLKDFVRAVRPRTIVPTVNSVSPTVIEKMLRHFLEFMDLSRDRKRLDSYFCKRPNKSSAGGVDEARPLVDSKASDASQRKRQRHAIDLAAGENRAGPGSEKLPRESVPGATRREPSSSPRPLSERENVLSATRTPRPKVVVINPYAKGQKQASVPLATSAAAPAAVVEVIESDPVVTPRVGADGTAPVELQLVDIEAQRAIMADIERRKREGQA